MSSTMTGTCRYCTFSRSRAPSALGSPQAVLQRPQRRHRHRRLRRPPRLQPERGEPAARAAVDTLAVDALASGRRPRGSARRTLLASYPVAVRWRWRSVLRRVAPLRASGPRQRQHGRSRRLVRVGSACPRSRPRHCGGRGAVQRRAEAALDQLARHVDAALAEDSRQVRQLAALLRRLREPVLLDRSEVDAASALGVRKARAGRVGPRAALARLLQQRQ